MHAAQLLKRVTNPLKIGQLNHDNSFGPLVTVTFMPSPFRLSQILGFLIPPPPEIDY